MNIQEIYLKWARKFKRLTVTRENLHNIHLMSHETKPFIRIFFESTYRKNNYIYIPDNKYKNKFIDNLIDILIDIKLASND